MPTTATQDLAAGQRFEGTGDYTEAAAKYRDAAKKFEDDANAARARDPLTAASKLKEAAEALARAAYMLEFHGSAQVSQERESEIYAEEKRNAAGQIVEHGAAPTRRTAAGLFEQAAAIYRAQGLKDQASNAFSRASAQHERARNDFIHAISVEHGRNVDRERLEIVRWQDDRDLEEAAMRRDDDDARNP